MAGEILYFLHRHFRLVAPAGLIMAAIGLALLAGWISLV